MSRFRGRETFITTKEHKRFVEFADAVRQHRYIGLCFGPAGVGKTLSARRYAHWDRIQPFILDWGRRRSSGTQIYTLAARTRTIFYTPAVGGRLRQMKDDLRLLAMRTGICISCGIAIQERKIDELHPTPIGMMIVDESERLTLAGFEYLRDLFDRHHMGLILTGMPGIERRLSRYPQLYSRVGFAHEYRPLRGAERTFFLRRHWRKLGLKLGEAEFTDTRAIAAIARLTGGNFRLVQRLFVQIERVLKINELSAITDDVVEAARSTLVIGAA